MILPDKVYNVLKWVAQLLLPAIGSLYFGLSQIWGFPLGEQIIGTCAVLATFLGVTLGISTANYRKTQEVIAK